MVEQLMKMFFLALNLFEDLKIEDIEIEAVLKDIDDGDDLEVDEEIDEIDALDDESVKFEFVVPLEVDADDYKLVIEAEGEDENGGKHSVSIEFTVQVEKENHDILIQTSKLSSNNICSGSTSLEIGLLNLGEDDEDEVGLTISNSELGINIEKTGIELEEGVDDSKYVNVFYIEVPSNVNPGIYPITIKTYYDEDKLSRTKIVDLVVKDCSTGEEIEVVVPEEVLEEFEIVYEDVEDSGFFGSVGFIILIAVVVLMFLGLETLLIVKMAKK